MLMKPLQFMLIVVLAGSLGAGQGDTVGRSHDAIVEGGAAVDVTTTSVAGVAESADDPRWQLADQLIERGCPREEAHALVASLTDEDVEVLAANPGMLAQAGEGDEEKWATILIISLLVGIGGAVILAVALSV